jgi:hypothetical protein
MSSQPTINAPPQGRTIAVVGDVYRFLATGEDRTLEKAVARYAGPKGNLQFPLDAPIPLDLIERIVNLRVKQDTEKAVATKSPTSRNPRKS